MCEWWFIFLGREEGAYVGTLGTAHLEEFLDAIRGCPCPWAQDVIEFRQSNPNDGSRKRMEKMAQFTPLGSRRGMLAGSCSMAKVGAGIDMAEGEVGVEADDDVAPGPIACRKLRGCRL